MPLKELARLLWDFDESQLYGPQEVKEQVDPRWGISSRTAMQRLGEGARQTLGKDVWARACVDHIMQATAISGPALWVIDDVRHINEVVMLVSHAEIDGYIIKLVCPDAPPCGDPDHPSEAQVDQVPDRYIAKRIISYRSPGSQDLLEQVDDALRALLVEK